MIIVMLAIVVGEKFRDSKFIMRNFTAVGLN